jgi:hypothetical protein
MARSSRGARIRFDTQSNQLSSLAADYRAALRQA